MRQNDFHVVVIDDKAVNCRRISDRISGLKVISGPDQSAVVSVSTVLVRVERGGSANGEVKDMWTFDKDTLDQLRFASRQKADMLIVDYIYIDPEIAKILREQALTTSVSEEDITHKALNPRLLREWVTQNPGLTDAQRQDCLRNIFDCAGPVYLHTYTPQGLDAATGAMEYRKRMASVAFPNGTIELVDTRAELFNCAEFDWPGPSKYDVNYYPFQLAALFGQIVQKEVVRSALERRPKPRRVFVVHGRAVSERDSVARLIETFGYEAVILDEKASEGKNILKKFRDFSDVGFAVVLLTGDDLGGLAADTDSTYKPRARQNVILELGFFLAKFGDARVCCLRADGVDVPSDYLGIGYVPLDAAGAWKLRLANELQAAGFDIDLNKLSSVNRAFPTQI